MLLSNNAAGGTNGVTETPANSGGASGNAWDTVVTPSGGGGMRFSNTHLHLSESMSHSAVEPATNRGPCCGQWDTSLGTVSVLFGRAYVYYETLPAATDVIVQGRILAGTNSANIQIGSTGLVTAVSGPTSSSTGASLVANAWNRIEWQFGFQLNQPFATVQVFVGSNAEGLTPDGSTTVRGLASQNGPFTSFRVGAGLVLTPPATPATRWIADVQVNDSGFPGPVSPPATPSEHLLTTMGMGH